MMLANEYAATLTCHWKVRQPKTYKRLMAAGTLTQEAQKEGRGIAARVTGMMETGMYQDEAKEIVQDEHYPAPETDH